MTLTLVIGNKNYSSWSLRPWLLLKHFRIEFREVQLSLDTPAFRHQIAEWSHAGRVPVLVDGEISVWDSLAIAEYINETKLAGRGWPKALADRARARSVVAEMHAGFGALRAELPMNLRRAPSPVATTDSAKHEITRVQQIWDECLTRAGGPWLFGDYSIADAFFAPVALRFATYMTPATPLSTSYQSRILVDPAVQEWCTQAAVELDWIAAEER